MSGESPPAPSPSLDCAGETPSPPSFREDEKRFSASSPCRSEETRVNVIPPQPTCESPLACDPLPLPPACPSPPSEELRPPLAESIGDVPPLAPPPPPPPRPLASLACPVIGPVMPPLPWDEVESPPPPSPPPPCGPIGAGPIGASNPASSASS